MTRKQLMRIGFDVLAVSSAFVGFWAGLAPRSFYDDFPGLGRHWVLLDGPYNEHLVRDVGWLNLALALVALLAAMRLTRALVDAAAGSVLVYGVPHFVYHLTHLDMYKSSDQVLMLTSLALSPIVAVFLLVAEHRGARPSATIPESPTPRSSSSTT
jgi:hypothetical protein